MKELVRTGHGLYGPDQLGAEPISVTLLGPFTIRLAGTSAGPWPRPSAKRLCELLMLRRDHRILKEVVRELLFPHLPPSASANALRKALSMARQAISSLGEGGSRLLLADREHICWLTGITLDIDLVAHEDALRSGLAMEPGNVRDATLSAGLLQDAVLLDDEPYSDWALEAGERLELLRQRARSALARDRTAGYGRSQPEAVIEAWESCLAHDPASEEAAANLINLYAVTGQPHLVIRTYARCRRGLQNIGLRPSPSIECAYQSATADSRGTAFRSDLHRVQSLA